ncbi:hypothetical protein [Demequina subtropica]|uniref:hypothetical protein n=1 Tax=Demequina subtropica TaxID=1638989 RepID=UPI0007820274|nr:hypothetical protein [Demequina subtropica]
MIDDRADHAGLTLDNYADLLALAGVERATAQCSYCPPGTEAVPANALYLLHDRSGDTENVGLMCPEHAGEWCSTGVIGVGAPLTAPRP